LKNNPIFIPEVGGADAHAHFILGYTWTEVNVSDSVGDILQAVERGFCKPLGRIIFQ